MIPTRGNVNDAVRSINGDTAVSGGALYTDTYIPPFLNLAYQEMFQRLYGVGAARIQREGYYLLPAYTPIFTPSLAGLSNFGGPCEMWERGSATSYAVSAATPDTPAAGSLRLTVAALPSTVVTGTRVETYSIGGITDDVNDSWILTVVSPTSVYLNGCTASGAYASSTGFVVYSTEQWTQMAPRDTQDSFIGITPQSAALGLYSWQKGVIRFPVCSTARELRVLYQLSSSLTTTAPSNGDSMGVDDSLSFLTFRTAELCAGSKGNKTREGANHARAEAALSQLISNNVQQLTFGEPVVPGRFRQPRNVWNYGIGPW